MSYFEKKSSVLRVNFGIPYFDVFDKKYSDISIPVAIRGTVLFRVKNMKRFLAKNGYGAEDYSVFENDVRTTITNQIKSIICNLPEKYSIPAYKLENIIGVAQDYLEDTLTARLKKIHNISILSFNITDIDLDKSSDGYSKLSTLTADAEYRRGLAAIETDTAKIKSTPVSTPAKSRKGLVMGCAIGCAVILCLVALLIKL